MKPAETDLMGLGNLTSKKPLTHGRTCKPICKHKKIISADAYFADAAETEIRDSESSFRSIAENANDGIMINTAVDGPYVYANQRASEISGYPIIELLQIGPQHLLPPAEYAQVRKLLERRFQGRRLPERYESGIIRKDGRMVPVEFSGSWALWQGRPAAIVLMRDMSLRKRIESERLKTNKELELRVSERTRELAETLAQFEKKQREIMEYKSDLERVTRELVQTNTALSVLARNIDKKSEELKQKIAHAVSSRLMPLIDEIGQDKIPEKSRLKLDVLAAYLKDLTPGISKSHEVIVSLSAMELRVAVMIKKAFSSEEIARLLHLSLHTVNTHRRNIRKKLGVSNSKINLSSYLKLKLARD
jgi:PAS domain S-box-containing protein